MATTWVGGDGTGAQQNDSSRGANWSTGSVPGSGDDVVIANVTHHCILATSYTWGSLEIETSAELEASSEKTITIDGEISNYGVKNDGIVTGDINLILTFYTNASLIKLNGSSGNFNDVTLNHTNADYETTSAATIDGDFIITAGTIHIGGTLTVRGNLTITAGELNTKRSGTDYDLQVDGNTSLGAGAGAGGADEATLTCNSSDLYLGSGYSSDYGLYVKRGGTFVGGTGPHIIGSISMEDYATAKLTLTTHASGTTLNAGDYGSDFPFTVGSDSTVTSTNSLVVIATSKSESTYSINAHNKLNDLTINSSGKTISLGQATTLAGNLTITAGTLDTSSSNHALTVTGEVNVAGTLTCNSSVCSFGSLDSTGLTNLADGSGSTLITNENSDGLSIVAGTYGTCVPAKIKHNNGTVTFNNHSDPAAHAAIVCGNSNATDGLYNVIIDGANTIVDTYDPGGSGQECKIHNNFTVTNGSFQVNGASNPFDVGGDVLVSAGKMFGDGSAPTGAMSFGSLTIESGAEFKATSGTTTITSETSGTGRVISNAGTFTHNKGLVKVDLASPTTTQIQNGPYWDLEQVDAATDFYAEAALTIYNNFTFVGDFDYQNNSHHLTVHGNMKIGDGSTTTRYCAQSANTNNLTVHGTLEITNGATADLGTHGTVNLGGIRNTGGSIS